MGVTESPVHDKADYLPGEAKDILKSLASKWDDVLDANELQVIPLKGAMTNEVFQIKWPTKTQEASRKVLVRIYGEGVDIFLDRNDEIRTFECMSKHGQGPRLLGRFANGRVEEFIHARTLSASDLHDSNISSLIAAKMKEFHDLDMPGTKKVHLWDRLRNWLGEAKRLCCPKEVEAFYLDTIEKEISMLEKELSSAHQRIGFCHNDLQYGNIMIDEETNSLTIIDYEYASYNPVAYDIANHFCEMAANYHTETPHILDFTKYPDLEMRQNFVYAYLCSSGEEPSESEVEHLLHEIEKYTLPNHLFWGIWGIISGHVNKIDFDYKEYATQRFQEYWSRKPFVLGSVGPSPESVIDDTMEKLMSKESTAKGHHHGHRHLHSRRLRKFLNLAMFRSKHKH
ncbi:probable choline kinase 2 isoform X1 [Neltuma alba]|uniref:probable choline kinase 2 isoform X1 n=1 Tax=Neltuma alba TaxID=207710 RepID=UPI0010A374AF|nr:probable choline kinase 2 isoform X1 [Prosopis alba]